jgi:hypothetical protein
MSTNNNNNNTSWNAGPPVPTRVEQIFGQPPMLENSSSVQQLQGMQELYNRSGNRVTQTTQAFWRLCNLQGLVYAIEQEVSRRAGFPVQVLTDDYFFLQTAEIATTAPNDMNVAAINAAVMAKMVEIYYMDILRRKLFYKYYIFEDRPRNLPLPLDTHGRHRIVRPSSYQYQSEDPKSQYWNSFQDSMSTLNKRIKRPNMFDVYYDKP